jgi:phosphoglucosamine mutase
MVRDTRASGPAVQAALVEGLGDIAVDAGVVPTAGLSAILAGGHADVGVAITASHNPFHDNGLKVLGADGGKLDDGEQAALEEEIAAQRGCSPLTATPTRIDGPSLWADAVCAALPTGWNLSGVRVVVDAAHGAGWEVAPALLGRLGAQVIPVGCAPDGQNINEGVGALHPEELVRAVRSAGAQVGIALDGDADRCLLVDETGRVVDGDGLLLLLARAPGLVGTVMCNSALGRALSDKGIGFVRTSVGDRQVAQEMKRLGWPVGGEPSGHVLFSDGLPTGDGLLTGLRALAGGVDLSQRLVHWQPSPQVQVSIRTGKKPPLEDIPGLLELAAEAEAGGAQRVLLRWSGTEPKLRVLVEAEDLEDATLWADRLVAQVASAGLTEDASPR